MIGKKLLGLTEEGMRGKAVPLKSAKAQREEMV